MRRAFRLSPAQSRTALTTIAGRVIHEPSVQRTSSPTAGMKPIIHQTSTGDLRAENRIVKRGQVRDIETIDSELRLVAALRRAARERGGP
jgi:hypothetical protein